MFVWMPCLCCVGCVVYCEMVVCVVCVGCFVCLVVLFGGFRASGISGLKWPFPDLGTTESTTHFHFFLRQPRDNHEDAIHISLLIKPHKKGELKKKEHIRSVGEKKSVHPP